MIGVVSRTEFNQIYQLRFKKGNAKWGTMGTAPKTHAFGQLVVFQRPKTGLLNFEPYCHSGQ